MNNCYITAPITVYQTCPKYFGQNTSHAEVVKRNFQKKKKFIERDERSYEQSGVIKAFKKSQMEDEANC